MVALQHRCEKLRDELIASDEPLTAFVSSHPDVDLQSLRQTIRMARREAAKEIPRNGTRSSSANSSACCVRRCSRNSRAARKRPVTPPGRMRHE